MGHSFGGKALLIPHLDYWEGDGFRFNQNLTTFTPAMAKRTGQGPFAAAPIVQGKWDGTGTPDVVQPPVGDVVSNLFTGNLDPGQGSMSFWITPEWDGADGLVHYVYSTSDFIFYKSDTDRLAIFFWDNATWDGMSVDISGWTAGTTYHVVLRWDNINTLDGTNYVCLSINNTHNFGKTSEITGRVATYILIGSDGTPENSANAIIEGLTIYRRPLFDGTYGFDKNGDGVDEIEDIYAAGAGADPAQITGASWDIVFCMPTNSTPEALVSGIGEAWSHPHSSAVLKETFMSDGGYMGEPYGVEFNGSTTEIDCGSDASLGDLHDAEFTVEMWARIDGLGGFNGGRFVDKASGSVGWNLFIQSGGQLRGLIYCATTNAESRISDAIPPDGKWHHLVMYFNDAGDRNIYFAVDGVWILSYSTQNAGVGAIVSDAAESLIIGNSSAGDLGMDGQMGWVRLSDNDRYSHETDFIPPVLMPAADGNTVEQWALDDGSGATVAATVAGANDGTLSNGTWVEQWDYQGSVPLKPTSIEFDGSVTLIDCGSAASLDDIPAGGNIIAVECWVRNTAGAFEAFLSKGNWTTNGWYLYRHLNGAINFYVNCDTTDANPAKSTGLARDNEWMHVVGYYDDTSKESRVAIDGVWGNVQTGVGNYTSDAGQTFWIGRRGAISEHFLNGAMAWARVSDNDRYDGATPTNFTPPSRINPPADDVNTVSLWNMDEGAGTTVADSNANANDGTLTPGTGGWLTTHDLSLDGPGEQRFGVGGYVFGVDAANEGIEQSHTGLAAGQDYVLRLLAHVDPSSPTDDIRVRIWDDTNGAQIGADFDFAAGSSWAEPGEALFTWELPTVARNGVASDCTAMTVMVLGTAAGQAINVHQCEVQENLIDNPSMETGSGDPWIPNGGWWTGDLDAGDSLQEAVEMHSGVACVEYATGAVSGEFLGTGFGAGTVGQFLAAGAWLRGDGGAGPNLWGQFGLVNQDDPAAIVTPNVTAAAWAHAFLVWRQTVAFPTFAIGADDGASGATYLDDAYAFALDDVSLTVTPASEINSTENGGRRVDGWDSLTQPIVGLKATKGKIAFRWTPRHGIGNFKAFSGLSPNIAHIFYDWTNYILLEHQTAANFRLSCVVGGISDIATWYPLGGEIVPGTTYLFEIEYDGVDCVFSVDGTSRITVTPVGGIDYGASIPNVANWGHQTGSNQTRNDAVFTAP